MGIAGRLGGGAEQDSLRPLGERDAARPRGGPKRLVDRIGHGNGDHVGGRGPAGQPSTLEASDIHAQL